MTINLNTESTVPVFRQLADQIHFAINTGELKPGARLPSIRTLSREHKIANNTVVKALRQLEFNGLIKALDRSGYQVLEKIELDKRSQERYLARGVSADKNEVHSAIDNIDAGLFPNAFCKITEDYLSGDPEKVNVIHADGSGTKSVIAYLAYKESGDASVFHGIAQDSIVMNIDDLLCIGATGRILVSSTINRNAMNIPGEVVSALIEGTENYLAQLRDQGLKIYSGGGETADVGDLTGTVVVDSVAVSIMEKKAVISGNEIVPGLVIVGLSSTGQANYESSENSGIGSNGLTSARHDLLSSYYAEQFPETYDPNMAEALRYCGPYRLNDPLANSAFSVAEGLLSPTRSYAPVIAKLLKNNRDAIKGIVHCSGGGQTKALKFGQGIHFIKDNLFQIPVIFEAIQQASGTSWQEMYKVFNMGHRMEIYCRESDAELIMATVQSFGIDAKIIGCTEASQKPDGRNHMSLSHQNGEVFEY